MPKYCVEEDCDKNALYNVKGGKPMYCKEHLEEGMVNVTKKICKHDDCHTRATFGADGEKAKFCSEHKELGMVAIGQKQCCFAGCTIIPTYNLPECQSGKYCFAHKDKDMIAVNHKSCLEKGCNVRPSYNKEGESPLYCKDHKKTNMVNVVSKTCAHENCSTIPSYNIEGKPSLYCVEHKKDNMVNVRSLLCLHDGCKVQPNYNVDDEKQGIYCFNHKLKGMVDVVHKSCKFNGCDTQPTFNFPGLIVREYCFKHKLEGMIDVAHDLCICKSEWCTTRFSNLQYEGYCLRCFVNLFPEKEISRNYKTKEKNVAEYVMENFSDYDWIWDKMVKGGESKRRPDLLLDLKTFVIIIEIDENQHNTYEDICENKRTMEISKDLKHKSCVFIRFNPDNFVDSNGTNIKSPWKANKRGIYVVDNKKHWTERLNKLKETINLWINKGTTKTIEIVPLYFNEKVVN